MRIAVASLVAAGLALSACGGGGEEGAIRDVMEGHNEAIADGDPGQACRDLTGEARKLVLVSIKAVAPDAVVTTCEDAYGAISKNLAEPARNTLRDADYDIELRGDRRAIVNSGATTGETELTKVGERWMISRINFGS